MVPSTFPNFPQTLPPDSMFHLASPRIVTAWWDRAQQQTFVQIVDNLRRDHFRQEGIAKDLNQFEATNKLWVKG